MARQQKILEVPASNQTAQKLENFKAIARELIALYE
jgi:hypothetical protein